MNQKKGFLEVISGCMFSGKTEELIVRIRSAYLANFKVLVIKPAIDNRYSEKEVVSHNGTKILAIPIKKAITILDVVEEDIQAVAIDEVQFLDKEIIDVVQELVNRGTYVIVSGLDLDFMGKPFGSVPSLMALADRVTKFQAICSSCGSPANRTQRLDNGKATKDESIILVGSSELYEPRCRQCHKI